MVNMSDQSPCEPIARGFGGGIQQLGEDRQSSIACALCFLGERALRRPAKLRIANCKVKLVYFIVAAALLLWTIIAQADAQREMRLASPSATATVIVSLSEDGTASYSVIRKGEFVISPSMLGLLLAKSPRFGPLRVINVERRTVDTHYPLVAGKVRQARDHFNEIKLALEEREGAKRRLHIVFRAYDDGIAFRYVIPQQPSFEDVLISGERTEFNFSGDYRCWGFNPGATESTHEGEYDPILASHLRSHYLYDVPLVCSTTPGTTYLAIAEADLQGYGALYLRGRVDGGTGVTAEISTHHDLAGFAAAQKMAPDGVRSPWRVLMMSDRAGQLITSNLIANLSSPSMIEDTSWIRPGKTAWYWFTADQTFDGTRAGMNMPTLQHYIDFAGRNGLEYALIDIGWSFGSDINGGNFKAFGESLLKEKPQRSDLTRSEVRLDMSSLVRRAREQGVGLIVWVHWQALDRQLDAAFSQFEMWGLKGVKVDFMHRSDQRIVDFFHRVLRKAAEHKLLVELHGSFHPTGMSRTWPNLITQEGVLGSEWNAFSKRVTATHNVTLPYTRMLLGAMDYTPGLFGNVTPDEFVATDKNTMAMYTRAQSLAMYVVYESPLQMLADRPAAYEGSAGFEFLKAVPTSWDETRFIDGEIGESIALARRRGREWYIGAMSNEEPRTMYIPLDFVGGGEYAVTIWSDGRSPVELAKTEIRRMRSQDTLTLLLAPSGGAAVRLSPEVATQGSAP